MTKRTAQKHLKRLNRAYDDATNAEWHPYMARLNLLSWYDQTRRGGPGQAIWREWRQHQRSEGYQQRLRQYRLDVRYYERLGKFPSQYAEIGSIKRNG